MVLCHILVALVMQGTPADTSDVTIENCRPSHITALMMRGRGLLPKGSRVEALDLEGKIRIHGPENVRLEMENYIHMFDVRPQPVELAVRVQSKVDKTDYRLQLEVPNNQEFSFTETTTGLKVSILPRVNGDASVTLFVSYGFAGKTYPTVVRVKQNGCYVLCHGPHGSCTWQGDLPFQQGMIKPAMLDPVLIVSPTVKDAH